MNKFNLWKHFKNKNNKRKTGEEQYKKEAIHLDLFRFFLQVRHDSLLEMLREAQSLNGQPPEVWCQRMYEILKTNVQNCKQQLDRYDQSREEEGGSPAE